MGNCNAHPEAGSPDANLQPQPRRPQEMPGGAVLESPVSTSSYEQLKDENETLKRFLELNGISLQSLDVGQFVKDKEEENLLNATKEEEEAEEEGRDGNYSEEDEFEEEDTVKEVEGDATSSCESNAALDVPDPKSRYSNINSKAIKLISGKDIRDINEIGMGMGVFGKAFKGIIQGKAKEKERSSSRTLTVAVKVFLVPLSMEKGNAQLVKLMGLKHRNIVSMIGVVLDDTNGLLAGPPGCPRILLEFFPEGNLLNYLSKKENPQDYDALVKLALDIVNGCDYLHSRNVIHGNLAARNILIEKSACKHKIHYNAKVSDYGISQLALETIGSELDQSVQSQEKGQSWRVDPIRWMPKELVEQIPNRLNFTKESDVWSFGVILWEVWTKGAAPFGSFSQKEIKKFLVRDGKSPLSIHSPHGCPEDMIRVMNTIFKVDPTERPSFAMLNIIFRSFKAHAHNHHAIKSRKGKSSDDVKEHDSSRARKRRRDRDRERERRPRDRGEKDRREKKETESKAKEEYNSQKKENQNRTPPQPSNRRECPPIEARPSRPHGAPPPYTPSPLPSHYQVKLNLGPRQINSTCPSTRSDLASEIQQKEQELQLLKTKHLQEQFMQKQNELDSIVRKMAENHIASVTVTVAGIGSGLSGSSNTTTSGSTVSPSPVPLMGMVLPPDGGIESDVDPYKFTDPPPPYGHAGRRGRLPKYRRGRDHGKGNNCNRQAREGRN